MGLRRAQFHNKFSLDIREGFAGQGSDQRRRDLEEGVLSIDWADASLYGVVVQMGQNTCCTEWYSWIRTTR